jgi:hypothetical protein
MDPNNLPEGYYYDPIHGQIEDFTKPLEIADAVVAANTFVLYHEVSRGLVGHAIDRDELGYKFMAVAKADDANPNIRFVDVYMAPPGSIAFDPHPVGERWYPTLKIDLPAVLCDGPDLLVSATTHAAQEAPRPTEVQAADSTTFKGICHVKTTPREGPCGPLGIPYFRPGNNLTRGQVSKIIVAALEASGFQFPDYDPNKQYFEDVAVGSVYHEHTAKLSSIGAIGGYACTPQ